jgi:AcrR family transcriptional regulator
MRVGSKTDDLRREASPRAVTDRPLRADAERNRRALLDAAAEMFRERGLDVGVGEIAQRAGVGRGTVFRRFPTKSHLIAAIIADRLKWAAQVGHGLLEGPDPGNALYAFLDEIAVRQRLDRVLLEGLDEEWMTTQEEIRVAHDEFVSVLDMLLIRAQAAGTVRPDLGALDVLMLFKGMCEAARLFPQDDPEATDRLTDLFCAALLPSGQKLRGRTPTLADLALPPREHPAAGSGEE